MSRLITPDDFRVKNRLPTVYKQSQPQRQRDLSHLNEQFAPNTTLEQFWTANVTITQAKKW